MKLEKIISNAAAIGRRVKDVITYQSKLRDNLKRAVLISSLSLFSVPALYSGLPKPLGLGTGASVSFFPAGPYKKGDSVEARVVPVARPIQGVRIQVNEDTWEELNDGNGIFIKKVNLNDEGTYNFKVQVKTDRWRDSKSYSIDVSSLNGNGEGEVTYTITKSAGLKFSGDDIFSAISFSGDVNSVESAVKEPSQSYSAYSAVPKTGSEYKKEVASSTFGNHSFKFRYKKDSASQAVDVPEEASVPVNMNEQQSDEIAYNKCDLLKVSTATAVDGDIIEVDKNLDHVVGGHSYNNDVHLKIKGTPDRYYLLDVQGSSTDTYNSAKYNDAKASGVSYKHLDTSHTLNKQDLEDKVQELHNGKWAKTF